MDSESESQYEFELESLCAKIARLKRENHDHLVFILRNRIGYIKDLDGFQTYMKS